MDAKAILDVLMQSGMGQSQQRLERTTRGNNPLIEAATSMMQGGGGGGGLGGMLSQVLGGGASTGSGGGGAGGGLGDILGSLLGGNSGGGRAAAGAGGGLAGGLIESLAKAAMSQMGGAGTSGAQAPGGGQAAAPGFDLSRYATGQMESRRDENDRALVMVRAMLSAAKADGKIDAGEQERILGKLNDAGATQEMRQFIQNELRQPIDIDGLAKEVDSPHMATEVYTASLFAIDVDTRGEQAYMSQLASRLGLPSTLVQQLHESLEVRGA
ncbi:MAG: tellurite resistance TerB family protein [Geminicoccaceae bacterium]